MVKFDDQASTLVEAIIYIVIDVIVIGLSIWMGTSLYFNHHCKQSDAPKLKSVLVYVPLVYYLISIIGAILGIVFDITFNQIYLNIFAILFSTNRLLLALFLFIRIWITFKQSELYSLSKSTIIVLSFMFVICSILFICYTVKCLLKIYEPVMIDHIAFSLIITAMFLDSLFTIIIAYLFFKTLFKVVLVSYQNDNAQPKLINVITKHTLLCCVASFTIQLATALRLITYLVPSLYESEYKIIILAMVNGMMYVAGLFSIHLSFYFATNQYYYMCKYCHNQCAKCCEKIIEEKSQNSFDHYELM